MRPTLFSVLMRRHVWVFDRHLFTLLSLLLVMSAFTMYSAAYNWPGRFNEHLRNALLALLLMWITTNLPVRLLQRLALPTYLVGLVLLLGVELVGDISKGAQRWLDLGFVRIQPSEMMKIAMPLMLAWWYHSRTVIRLQHHIVALLLLLLPIALIARQPDLGTAILVFASGIYVVYFSGLSWLVITGGVVGGIAALPVLWHYMHDYQRERVLTLLDPTTDPLGKGFHIIQSEIAVGSGGLWGKGWLEGTQTHLQFIPERTTDFVFAVFGEEFGLVGAGVLLALYVGIIGRGLLIAAQARTLFERLLAAALAMMFFTYAFVNIGMVTGILPVVGVPLPMMSYGGTAMVTLGLGLGMLMSIQRHSRMGGGAAGR